MRRRKKKVVKNSQLLDYEIDINHEKIMEDLSNRINNLTGVIEEIRHDDYIEFKTRNMTFAKIVPKEDSVDVIFELPYDRILDMNQKCQVEPYAAEDRTDIVTYSIKTKFDIQYAVSIAQQSFMYRKRLKL